MYAVVCLYRTAIAKTRRNKAQNIIWDGCQSRGIYQPRSMIQMSAIHASNNSCPCERHDTFRPLFSKPLPVRLPVLKPPLPRPLLFNNMISYLLLPFNHFDITYVMIYFVQM